MHPRDLMEGADKIMDIAKKCGTVLSNVLAIQENIAALAVGVSSTPAEASMDGSAAVVRKHNDLHGELSSSGIVRARGTMGVWKLLMTGCHSAEFSVVWLLLA